MARVTNCGRACSFQCENYFDEHSVQSDDLIWIIDHCQTDSPLAECFLHHR